MRRCYHIYGCESCDLIFAVEVAYEEQSAVVCPVCNLERGLAEIGYGEMIEVHASFPSN